MRDIDRRRALRAVAGLGAIALGSLSSRVRADAAPRPWPAGQPTPALAVPAWEGEPFDLAQARGRVVALNFWASWCEPCRAEMPSLELLAARFEDDGLVVVAVNHRETDAAIRRYLAQMPITLPVLRDRDGAVARDWGVRVFPTTVLVGRDGRAAFSVVGEVDWTGPTAQGWVAPLLKRAA